MKGIYDIMVIHKQTPSSSFLVQMSHVKKIAEGKI
jgi:hypothetical protein